MPNVIDLNLFLGNMSAEPTEGYAPLGVQFSATPAYSLIVEVNDPNTIPDLIVETNDSDYLIKEI